MSKKTALESISDLITEIELSLPNSNCDNPSCTCANCGCGVGCTCNKKVAPGCGNKCCTCTTCTCAPGTCACNKKQAAEKTSGCGNPSCTCTNCTCAPGTCACNKKEPAEKAASCCSKKASTEKTSGCGNPSCTCTNCTCAPGTCACNKKEPAGKASTCGNPSCTCTNCTCAPGTCACNKKEGQKEATATTKICPNKKCLCPDCTCGDGCTCNISEEVTCDPCKDFKAAKLAAKAAAPKPAPAPRTKAAPAPVSDVIDINSMDFRVGVITSVKKHDTAEKLYTEEIDVGEAEPRQIASGLVPYYTLEEMQGRRLIAVCNLKPRNLVGFKSHGMVLCASKTLPDGTTRVEFVDPPPNAKPGDRVFGLGLTGEPLSVSQCDKKKVFDLIAPDLKVNEEGIAYWKDVKLVIASGEHCTAPTLRDAPIH